MSTVIGVFSSRDHAEKAVSQLRSKGFADNEISIVAKDERQARAKGEEGGGMSMGAGENIADGTTTGGVLGGVAGLLAGVGALAIPGIGPIVAAGPIAATLTGAVTGGLVGGLVDMGVPEERGRYYESKVREGKILAAVEADSSKIDEAARTMRENGATDVESHR